MWTAARGHRVVRRGPSGLASKIAGIVSGAPWASHLDLAGQALGRHLLLDAFEVCLVAADLIGGRLLVVDAIDEGAAGWYEHRGFVRLPASSRLFLKTSTIAATVRVRG